jgi:hypothetical protein
MSEYGKMAEELASEWFKTASNQDLDSFQRFVDSFEGVSRRAILLSLFASKEGIDKYLKLVSILPHCPDHGPGCLNFIEGFVVYIKILANESETCLN